MVIKKANKRHTSDGHICVMVYTGTDKYALGFEAQAVQDAEIIALVKEHKLSSLASEKGIIVREDQYSSVGRFISAETFNS